VALEQYSCEWFLFGQGEAPFPHLQKLLGYGPPADTCGGMGIHGSEPVASRYM
jgi:hypothetical protein